MTPLGLTAYRGLTALLEFALAPALKAAAPRGGAWRASWTAPGEEVASAAGSVWVHAASMGEMVAARHWIEALVRSGYRAPLLVTTRTQTGLDRARRDLAGRASARVAPQDAPRLLAAFFLAAAPYRLDLVETELWPNLILEARRRRTPVAFVSGAVSERTARRLLALGLAGPRLLGQGVWSLAQSERHADRFRALGIPAERIRVVGDLKAEPPVPDAARAVSERTAVVLGSLRSGEEDLALRFARALAREPRGPALLVAPRHPATAARTLALLRRSGIAVDARDESGRSATSLADWVRGLSGAPHRVGLLGTRGELAQAFAWARLAVIGGSFRPFGGHSVLEPAARGAPVLVGPHHEAVEGGVEALRREGAVVVAESAEGAVEAACALLGDEARLAAMGEGARRAAARAGGAVERALEALRELGLEP